MVRNNSANRAAAELDDAVSATDRPNTASLSAANLKKASVDAMLADGCEYTGHFNTHTHHTMKRWIPLTKRLIPLKPICDILNSYVNF